MSYVAVAAPNCTTTLPANGIVVEGVRYTYECNVYFGAAEGIWPETTWTGPGQFNQLSVNQTGTVLSGIGFDVQKVMDAGRFTLLTNFTQRGFGGIDYADNIPDFQHILNTITLFVRCKYMSLCVASLKHVHVSEFFFNGEIPSVLLTDCDSKKVTPTFSISISIPNFSFKLSKMRFTVLIRHLEYGPMFIFPSD
jgi:hypothetical protein